MSLHLSEVCDESLRLVGKAGDYWGGSDIVGLDALGRVHLFELKAGGINAAAARQLSHYLLRHVFVDPMAFTNRWWKRMNDWELRPWRLTSAIAGALAGQRTDNIGRKFAKRWGVDPGVTQYGWGRLSAEAKHVYLLPALLAKAKQHLAEVPTPEEVLEVARRWCKRMRSGEALPQGAFACRRPVVIWLVGSHFTPEAEEEVRQWRAAGVDARCLQAELRHSDDANGLILRIAREDAPARTRLLRCLVEWATKHPELSEKPELKFDIYTQVQPSSRRGAREKAGQLKDRAVARIKLSTGEVQEFVAS